MTRPPRPPIAPVGRSGRPEFPAEVLYGVDALGGATPVSPPDSRRTHAAAHADLDALGILARDPPADGLLRRLRYRGHPLPSFVLPPEDLNRLRILHGSCRKPHGLGKEMLSAIDAMIEHASADPADRPQQ